MFFFLGKRAGALGSRQGGRQRQGREELHTNLLPPCCCDGLLQGFPDLSMIDVLGQIVLCWGEGLECLAAFLASTPSKHCQALPGEEKKIGLHAEVMIKF